MSDVNLVVASGKIGKINTKMVSFGEGDSATTTMVTTFGVMSIDSYKGKDKKTLVRCSAWGEELSREISAISEGDTVILQGKLSSRKDPKTDAWSTEVSVNKVSLVGSPSRTEPLGF